MCIPGTGEEKEYVIRAAANSSQELNHPAKSDAISGLVNTKSYEKKTLFYQKWVTIERDTKISNLHSTEVYAYLYHGKIMKLLG